MITVSKKWIRLIGIVGCTVWMASCKQASDAGVKSSSYAVMQIEAVDKEIFFFLFGEHTWAAGY